MLINAESSIDNILISEDELLTRINEVAKEVDDFYKDETEPIVLIGVLKGATYVMSDFSKRLQTDSVLDWMCLSSYGSGTKSSGVVRVVKDITIDVKGKNILIVEDILDSGLTLNWLVENLRSKGAKSVEIFTLLRKLTDNKLNSSIDLRWVGFEIPDKFVVGYGLDYAERFRTLPYIAELSEEVYS